jgi:3-dehydroquinate dehydratase-2
MQIGVFNGVNLDMLGERNPEIYGGISYNELETRIYAWAAELGCSARCKQTNHEGELVDNLHEARSWADGIVINPGAWTHYSYAIHDALELFDVPIVEVHLSDITRREEWRRHSVIEAVASHRVMGEGPDGYRRALTILTGTE